MEVVLRGSSPAAMTAGIMLLSRARQLGDRLGVSVIGDPEDVIAVPGPAVCYAPVLASCGVGRKHGSGATVVVSGPPGRPVLVTVHPHGEAGWFLVDRTGAGAHPASEAFVRLSRDSRQEARQLGKDIRRGMEALGCSTDPAVLDVLFGAEVMPLTRLAVALRAGRALSNQRGAPITRFLAPGGVADHPPLGLPYSRPQLEDLLRYGGLQWILDRFSTSVRDRAETWVDQARALAADDAGRDLVLVYHLAEVLSHLVQLPANSILPPLGAAEDSVAVGLAAALHAEGDGDAMLELSQMFRFLGGKYVKEAEHSHFVAWSEPPDDLVKRWEWFCSQVRKGRKRADALWPEIIDPPQ